MSVRNEFLTIPVVIRVPVEGVDVNRLEELCMAAACQAMVDVVKTMQNYKQQQEPDRLVRRGWKRRYVTTRLGEAVLPILIVRDLVTGKNRRLGTEMLGLKPRQHVTAWVERQGIQLRIRGLSYRTAARTMGEMLGARLSGMSLWRRVQEKGSRQERREQEQIQAVFKEPVRSKAPTPQYLYLEADEVHLRAQRSGTDTHRVKVGLSYTGRERVKGYAEPRYRLSEKRVYAGVETLGRFGHGWYGFLETHYHVSETEAVLYLTDGDRGLKGLQEHHFPQAIRQMDWAHVFRDIGAACPNETTRKRWIRDVCRGKLGRIQKQLTELLRTQESQREAREKLSRCLTENAEDLQGWRRFRSLHDPEKTQRLPRGTGGVEKNLETMIVRTMKRRGMSWTARGANHLVKLLMAWHDKTAWNQLWMEPPPLT